MGNRAWRIAKEPSCSNLDNFIHCRHAEGRRDAVVDSGCGGGVTNDRGRSPCDLTRRRRDEMTKSETAVVPSASCMRHDTDTVYSSVRDRRQVGSIFIRILLHSVDN